MAFGRDRILLIKWVIHSEYYENVMEGQKKPGKKTNPVIQADDSGIRQQYNKLKSVHELQRCIARQNMHNAMSPMSAVSGYLELLNHSLSNNSDEQKINYYRERIESGLMEVNLILEQLQEMYSDSSVQELEDSNIQVDVDLNWMLDEVLNQLNGHKYSINRDESSNPVYVHTDLFMCKLIVLNMLRYAENASLRDSEIKLKTSEAGGEAQLSVIFELTAPKKEQLLSLMDMGKAEAENDSFSEGLINCKKLAGQINGEIRIMSAMGTTVMIKLIVPAADK